jgi:aerobic-type carbon monoxide dehydrogenase small subunit (CoxS/CutS family)
MNKPMFQVRIDVNGTVYERTVECRMLLCDFLRHELLLTGTHVGCEHGVCGCCTVLIDGEPMRSCLTLTAQADGRKIRTVESLAAQDDMEERQARIGKVEEGRPMTESLSILQASFWKNHGLQCGFCTPGILMTMEALLTENPDPTREQVRDALSGHICRCTGYHDIIDSVLEAAEVRRKLAQEGASTRDLLRRAYLSEQNF